MKIQKRKKYLNSLFKLHNHSFFLLFYCCQCIVSLFSPILCCFLSFFFCSLLLLRYLFHPISFLFPLEKIPEDEEETIFELLSKNTSSISERKKYIFIFHSSQSSSTFSQRILRCSFFLSCFLLLFQILFVFGCFLLKKHFLHFFRYFSLLSFVQFLLCFFSFLKEKQRNHQHKRKNNEYCLSLYNHLQDITPMTIDILFYFTSSSYYLDFFQSDQFQSYFTSSTQCFLFTHNDSFKSPIDSIQIISPSFFIPLNTHLTLILHDICDTFTILPSSSISSSLLTSSYSTCILPYLYQTAQLTFNFSDLLSDSFQSSNQFSLSIQYIRKLITYLDFLSPSSSIS